MRRAGGLRPCFVFRLYALSVHGGAVVCVFAAFVRVGVMVGQTKTMAAFFTQCRCCPMRDAGRALVRVGAGTDEDTGGAARFFDGRLWDLYPCRVGLLQRHGFLAPARPVVPGRFLTDAGVPDGSGLV